MASQLRRCRGGMGRDRCLFCDGFIFAGDDVARPSSLGLTVHRQCYLRDAGLDVPGHAAQPDDASAADDPVDC